MSVIIKQKQARILEAVKQNADGISVSGISKESGVTYVHVCNFINECERLGIFKSERKGKTKMVALTEKGKSIADMVSGIETAIGVSALPVREIPKQNL